MWKLLPISIVIISYLLSFSGTGICEYIRATNSDEVILVPTESEVNMGKSLAGSVEKRFALDDDTSLQKRINDIGQRLASVCDRKDITYSFSVLSGQELEPEYRLNAFALPGGHIYIFRAMVDLMESDDEIAAVIAHEIGHIAAKHSVKRFQGSIGMTLLQLLTARIKADNETKSRAFNAVGLLMMSYSREDEAMADKLSVRYVKKAGFNPEGVIGSIDKMWAKYRKMPIKKYTDYQTHPYTSERMAAAKKEVYGRMEFVDFINTPASLGKR